jgi:MerR family transcriptional regulator, copper efflux regulator
MYIGKLAESTGATPKAIRLYKSLGLIPVAIRQGTYRVYSDNDVVLVNMIRRAQTGARFPIEVAHGLIASKREKLGKQMDEVRLLDRRLTELERELALNFGNPTNDS